MKWPRREVIERLREQYPNGCTVVLDHMDDPQAPPEGTQGTVVAVDALGDIIVRWSTGSGLAVVYGVDKCHRIK